MSKRMSENLDKDRKKDQREGQNDAQNGKKQESSPKPKRTMQFDEGQKFTSDEDILKRRTA